MTDESLKEGTVEDTVQRMAIEVLRVSLLSHQEQKPETELSETLASSRVIPLSLFQSLDDAESAEAHPTESGETMVRKTRETRRRSSRRETFTAIQTLSGSVANICSSSRTRSL